MVGQHQSPATVMSVFCHDPYRPMHPVPPPWSDATGEHPGAIETDIGGPLSPQQPAWSGRRRSFHRESPPPEVMVPPERMSKPEAPADGDGEDFDDSYGMSPEEDAFHYQSPWEEELLFGIVALFRGFRPHDPSPWAG